MLDPRQHVALAVIDREWPGRYLEVTEGYCHVYGVTLRAEEVIGQTVGDLFPPVLDEAHPWGQRWRERFDRALAGKVVGDADPTPDGSGVAAFVVIACHWKGEPAFLIRIQGTTTHIVDNSMAIAYAVLDPTGKRLEVDDG